MTWWLEDKNPHEALFEYVRTIEENQRDQHELHLRCASLYESRELESISWKSGIQPGRRKRRTQVTDNIVRQVVDTVQSIVASKRPRPVFLTDGANFSTQRRAKYVERYIEGLFQKHKVYQHSVNTFRDGTLFGTGCVKLSIDDLRKEIEFKRILIDEIIVDEVAATDGQARQVHHRRRVDGELLAAKFPQHKFKILEIQAREERRWTSYRKVPQKQVLLIEGWSLPYYAIVDGEPVKMPGRYVMALEDVTLVDEPYESEDFPFVFVRWGEPVCGWYGTSLVEDVAGKQIRVNDMNRFFKEWQDLVAFPRVWVERGSQVSLQALNGDFPGAVYEYSGVKPHFETPQAVSNELYEYRASLKSESFEDAGVSRYSAQSQVPPGVEAGVALRHLSDTETQRFAIQAQAYEAFLLEIAKRMVVLAKEIAEETGEYKVVWNGEKLSQRIDWKEVELGSDVESLTIQASSMLPRTPAGRISTVMDMVKGNLISDPLEARQLLGMPDLERADQLALAPQRDIERVIERLLDNKPETPEPYQALQWGLPRVQSAYLQARSDGAPEEILENFRAWMSQAEEILNKAQASKPAPVPQEMPPEQQAAPGGM